jgi:hypothetical protein
VIDFISNEEFLDIVEKKEDFSDGDLCLVIQCHRCLAMFELSKESAAMAVMMKTSFWEYVKFVQHGKCPSCNKDKS